MKRTLISSILLLAGILETSAIFISAAICLPSTSSWLTSYSSKLWFLIFAGNSPYNDGANGLGLGFFFVIGTAMMFVGLLGLVVEYVQKSKTNKS